jgi:hypothetical protein
VSTVLPQLEHHLRDAWATAHPARRPAPRRRYAALVAAVAAVTIIAGIVVFASGGGGTLAKAAALEHAASAVEGLAAPSLGPGQYWYTRSVQAEVGGVPNGIGGHVQHRQTVERWVGLDEVVRGRLVQDQPRFLGTARERARWQAAGRPAPSGIGSFDRTFRAGAGVTPIGIPPGARGAQFSSPLGNLSYDQVRGLPTEPGAMLARIQAAAARLRAQLGRRIAGSNLGQQELRFYDLPVAAGMLVDVPLSPGSRAAVYRALERIPGIGYAPHARDSLGRSGAALTTNGAAPFLAGSGLVANLPYPFVNELVFDPSTGALLAQQAVLKRRVAGLGVPTGFPLVYTAYVTSGAVNSALERPAGTAGVR